MEPVIKLDIFSPFVLSCSISIEEMIAPRKDELLPSDVQNPQEAAPLRLDYPNEMSEVQLQETEEPRVDYPHSTSLLSLFWPSRSPLPVEPAFPVCVTGKDLSGKELETGPSKMAAPVVSLVQSAVSLECCLVSAPMRRS
jgi:hypothetical protein